MHSRVWLCGCFVGLWFLVCRVLFLFSWLFVYVFVFFVGVFGWWWLCCACCVLVCGLLSVVCLVCSVGFVGFFFVVDFVWGGVVVFGVAVLVFAVGVCGCVYFVFFVVSCCVFDGVVVFLVVFWGFGFVGFYVCGFAGECGCAVGCCVVTFSVLLCGGGFSCVFVETH